MKIVAIHHRRGFSQDAGSVSEAAVCRNVRGELQVGEKMTTQNSLDPLHGVTLKMILAELVERFGWEELGKRIDIRCFTHEPSIPSSLKFLRRTPWARDKVEEMFLLWKLENLE